MSVTFPDLNSAPFGSEEFQTNLIMPKPCPFLSRKLPPCSIIRPTKGIAKGVVKFLTDTGLLSREASSLLEDGIFNSHKCRTRSEDDKDRVSSNGNAQNQIFLSKNKRSSNVLKLKHFHLSFPAGFWAVETHDWAQAVIDITALYDYLSEP